MTMTPEERAAKVCAELDATAFGTNAHLAARFASVITAAIRAAENDALERAKQEATKRAERERQFAEAYERHGELDEMKRRVSGRVIAAAIAEDIDALKHGDQTPVA